MPQTRDNGIVVPVNSDAYNPTQALQDLADSAAVVTVVANTTARNALDPFNGRQVYRLDAKQIEAYVDGAWRTGTTHYNPLNNIAQWSVSGTITVTPEGLKRRVCVDIQVERTGGAFTLPTDEWSLVGTVVPAAAQGSSPVKYLSCALVGGTNNYTVNVSFNPGGAVSVRAIASTTFTTGAFFNVNVVYYI